MTDSFMAATAQPKVRCIINAAADTAGAAAIGEPVLARFATQC